MGRQHPGKVSHYRKGRSIRKLEHVEYKVLVDAKVLLFPENNHLTGAAGVSADGNQSEVLGYRSLFFYRSNRLRWIIPVEQMNQENVVFGECYFLSHGLEEKEHQEAILTATNQKKLEIIVESLRENLEKKQPVRKKVTNMLKGKIKKEFSETYSDLLKRNENDLYYYQLKLNLPPNL